MTKELREQALQSLLCEKCGHPRPLCGHQPLDYPGNVVEFQHWGDLFSKEYIRVNDGMRKRRHDD